MIFAPVVFTPEAREQISALYRWIAAEASPEIALRYTEAVIAQCEALSSFPERGTLRDDIRPGLRITSYRKRTVIAFAIETDRVTIIGVFHGGQNYQGSGQKVPPQGSRSIVLFRGERLELGEIVANQVPWCLGAHKDVGPRGDRWWIDQGAKRDVHISAFPHQRVQKRAALAAAGVMPGTFAKAQNGFFATRNV